MSQYFISTSASIADWIVAIAASATVAIAGLGLFLWKRQLRGRAEYEAAMSVLESAYGVLDGIKHVRRPMISMGEYLTSAEAREIEYDPKKLDQLNGFVYEDRWVVLSAAIDRFDTARRRGQVLWGLDFEKCFKSLQACIVELRYSVRTALHGEGRGVSHEKIMAAQDVVYSVGNEPSQDPFLTEVLAALEQIDERVRPYLLSKRTTDRGAGGT